MTSTQYNKMSNSEKQKEDWMNAKWRPMMGWMYMLVCTCDFVIFPVLWAVFHAMMHSANIVQWQPITLQGAGLFHMAMGAIIGVAAFGRTQEKLAGKANDNVGGFGGFGSPAPMHSGFGSPAPTSTTVTQTFGSPASNGFGGGGFGSPAPTSNGFGGARPIATTASGKKIVPEEDQPLQ